MHGNVDETGCGHMTHGGVNHDMSPLWRGIPGLQLAKSSESAARSRLCDDEPPPEIKSGHKQNAKGKNMQRLRVKDKKSII